jgi:hypothetical protein
MTGRFDIGRKDEGSVSGRPDFFRIGVKNASLKQAGKRPESTDRLNKYVRNGDSKSATLFIRLVGSGSAADDLFGRRAIAASISDTVNGENVSKRTPSGTVENVGVGASDVLARIRSTLSTK